MNNIVLFRGHRFATKISTPYAFAVSAGTRPAECNANSRRPRLIAVWHTNSHTGKLECFWTTERESVSDEDDSRRAA